MAKIKVEFINTCPCCNEHGDTIKAIASQYDGEIDVSIYYAGKDFDYLKKYGMINKGTMIINEKKKYDNLSKDIIEKAITEALKA